MKLSCVKTGFPFFDILHAYGLLVFCSEVTRDQASIEENDLAFFITCEIIDKEISIDFLDTLFPLPDITEWNLKAHLKDMSYQIFDGLLAVLFSAKGSRKCSVFDVDLANRKNPETLNLSYKKISLTIRRWKKILDKQIKKSKGKWRDQIFKSYEFNSPSIPRFEPISGNGTLLVIPMTIDPYLAMSYRSEKSDCQTWRKTSISILAPSYAVFLAYLGASRFLRAQRVGNGRVNYYVPKTNHFSIQPGFTLPILFGSGLSSQSCLALHIINLCLDRYPYSWTTVMYQVMVRNKFSPISYESGQFDFQDLRTLPSKVLKSWRKVLLPAYKQNTVIIDHFLEFLLKRNGLAFLKFMAGQVIDNYMKSSAIHSLFDLSEIRRILMTVNELQNPNEVMMKDWGTLRFGEVLRKLARMNLNKANEYVYRLRRISNLNDFQLLIGNLLQDCVIANSKIKAEKIESSLIIYIPDQEDLFFLFEDVKKYGVRTISLLLIILMFVYRHKEEEESTSQISEIMGEEL